MNTLTLSAPKSDQFQISPAAWPEILHHTVWGIWLHSLLRWKMIILPILTTSLIHISLKAVGRMYFLNLAVMFKTSSMHYLAGGTNNTNGVPRTESSLKEFPSFSLFTPVKTMSDFLLQSEMHPLACGGACSITHVRRQIPLSFKLTKTFIIRNFSVLPMRKCSWEYSRTPRGCSMSEVGRSSLLVTLGVAPRTARLEW